MYFCYLFNANGDCFPYFGSGYRFGGSLYSLFWWDDYLVLNGKYRHHPMAAIGRWIYRLGKCIGRNWSDHGQLHDCCTHKHDVLPGCSN
jgi:hypothetical protein